MSTKAKRLPEGMRIPLGLPEGKLNKAIVKVQLGRRTPPSPKMVRLSRVNSMLKVQLKNLMANGTVVETPRLEVVHSEGMQHINVHLSVTPETWADRERCYSLYKEIDALGDSVTHVHTYITRRATGTESAGVRRGAPRRRAV